MICWHQRLGPSGRDTLKFGAALLGGVTAIYALLLNVQARRGSAATKFIERWNDPKFEECRKAISATLDGEFDKIEVHTTRHALNFFEELAICAHRKEADEEILRDFFYTVALMYFRSTHTWIKERRQLRNQPTAYIHYEKLYGRWESKT